ncbi:hypothetical protein [Candidatus Poseidonia alphae]
MPKANNADSNTNAVVHTTGEPRSRLPNDLGLLFQHLFNFF